MKKILGRILLLGILVTTTIFATNAFFSDTETSVGNTFSTGELDLAIDNISYLNSSPFPGTTWQFASLNDGNGPGPDGSYLFFNFNDLKPDDEGEDTISLHVANDAWACMSITKTADDDVICTEPELIDDPDCTNPGIGTGELGGLLEFVFWADDGDNVLETDENVFKQGTAATLFDGAIWTLSDSHTNIWNGTGPLLANQSYYIGKAWCFGTLTLDPVGAGLGQNPTIDAGINCDGTTLNNASQTDKFMADIVFTAEQARHNDGFVCVPQEPCEPQQSTVYAASVTAVAQGTRKDGSAVLPERVDPNNAVGAPNWVSGTGTNFFSLGVNGTITLAFANPVFDGPGDDLSFHEATNSRNTYPLESAQVEVSADGTTWFSLGNVTSEPGGDGVVFKDISSTGLESILYVRLTDNTDFGRHTNDADGYDLDAIDGVYGECTVPEPE